MKVTISPSPPPETDKLVVDGVNFSTREGAERWVKAIKLQIDLLWPKKKPEPKK